MWRAKLKEDYGGAGTGYLADTVVHFDKGPTILTQERVWATSQEQISNPQKKPREVHESRYTLTSGKFVPKTADNAVSTNERR
jgi:hypothetical protein